MALNKKQKQYIRKKRDIYTTKHLAKKLKVSEKEIKKYIKKIAKYKKALKEKQGFAINSLKKLVMFLHANIPFLLLFTGLCIVLYANAIPSEFVSDDIAEYVTNDTIKNPREVFLNFKTLRIQTALYAINYLLFKINPIPLHVVSLLLHILNTTLVFILAYMFFGKRVAVITTLLFAAHPVNTEAIVWISAINYLWGTTAVLLILLSHTLYVNSKKYIYTIITGLLFALAAFVIKSPWLMIIPLVLIVVDQMLLREKIDLREFIKYMIPLGIGCLIFFITTIWPLLLPRIEFVEGLNKYSPSDKLPYIIHGPYTVLMALKLLIYPKDLTFYHEGEPLGQGFFIASKIASVAMIVLILMLWRKRRKITGLILAIFASLAPSLSPIQIAWYIADRYLYLSAVFFCMIIGIVLTRIERNAKIKNLAMIATVLILTVYSIRTVIRNSDWRTPKRLWIATAKVSEGSPRVYNNLGDIYSREGDYQRAIVAFQKSIDINPKYAEARYNLGRTYMLVGENDKAEQKFREAIEIKPHLYQAHYTLGLVRFRKGYPEEARTYIMKSLEINPNYKDAQKTLEELNNVL